MEQIASDTSQLAVQDSGECAGTLQTTDKTDQPTSLSKSHFVTPEQQDWILYNLVHIGFQRKIKEQFLEKWGVEISQPLVSYYLNNDKFQPKLKRIREKFESEVSKEPLASHRTRISLVGQLLETAMDNKNFKLATECIRLAKDLEEGTKRIPSYQFFNFNQNNYGELTLEDIRKEKYRLWDQMYRVKMKMEQKYLADSSNHTLQAEIVPPEDNSV